MNRFLLIFSGLLLSLSTMLGSVSAAPAEKGPIEVTSERMEGFSAPRRVLFSGNVVATQADVVIYADQMTVFFSDNEQEVTRILAQGRVRIVQGDRIATGEQGVFHRDQEMIVLTGNPRVHQGKDSIEGDEITVYLRDERSLVKSREGAPARAIFHPRESSP